MALSPPVPIDRQRIKELTEREEREEERANCS